MSPGNRAIEQIFEALREEEGEGGGGELEEARPEPRDEAWWVEHVPADTVPTVW